MSDYPTARQIIDTRLAQMRHDECIWCPRCGKEQENDDCQYPVTYHGSEDGPKEMDCQHCEKPFWVVEHVRRTYQTSTDPRQLP